MIRFDVKYKFNIKVETNGYHEFFGERGWTIRRSETHNGFILEKPIGYSLDDPIIAVYNDTQEYPLGLKKWNIMNDNCPGNGEHFLSFSSCTKSQFTCNDGACVPLKLKCDQIKHCPDNSDELDCNNIQVDAKSYNKNISPKNIERARKTVDQQIHATIDIQEFRVLEIDDLKETIDVRFWLTMKWIDSRVTFINLKPFEETILTEQDAEKLWMPQLILAHTNQYTRTSDSDATIKAYGDLPIINPDFTHKKEAIYYEGYNTPLTSKALYHQTFSCHFDVTMFPFDSHCCNVILRLPHKQEKFVQLLPRQAWNIDLNYNSIGM